MLLKKLCLLLLLTVALYADGEKIYTVAFAQDTLDNDYRIAQLKEIEKSFEKEKNIRFIYSNAKANAAVMVLQLEDFIAMGVDVIMVSPANEYLVVPVLEKAYAKGIPVILVDRGIQSDRYTTFIHPDNTLIAEAAARYMAEKMGYRGTILMLKGVPDVDVTRERTDAFLKVIGRYKKIRVIARSGNFLRRDTILAMKALHSSGETYDAIYSQSDSMLSGVRLFMKREGIDPASVLMVGIDYIDEARQAIRNGSQDSSFIYSLCGKESAEAAMALLRGETVPKEIILKSEHVTRENVDAIDPIF